MERIGIYGGTFNPPHIGHIQAAKQAVKASLLKKSFYQTHVGHVKYIVLAYTLKALDSKHYDLALGKHINPSNALKSRLHYLLKAVTFSGGSVDVLIVVILMCTAIAR